MLRYDFVISVACYDLIFDPSSTTRKMSRTAHYTRRQPLQRRLRSFVVVVIIVIVVVLLVNATTPSKRSR